MNNNLRKDLLNCIEIVKKKGLKNEKFIDLSEQEFLSLAYLAYKKAIQTYDSSKKVKFKTHLINYIYYEVLIYRNEMDRLNESQRRDFRKGKINFEFVPITEWTSVSCTSIDKIDQKIDLEVISKVINHSNLLSEMEKFIINKHYFEGVKLIEISEELGLPKENVYYNNRKAILKLKDYFNKDKKEIRL